MEAMRESLERVGRFDPIRARDRFLSGFSAQHTRHIEADGRRVGFVVAKPQSDFILLDHLYIRPGSQGQGIGAIVLARVIEEADARGLPVRVGALRGSDSNRFYERHGFRLVEQGEFDNYYVRTSEGRSARMTAYSNDVQIVVSPPLFSNWTALLALLRSTYAYMESRIDPPSSLLRMDAEQLEEKARDEVLILALEPQRLVGCAFASLRDDCVYVGKLAVDEAVRRQGVARKIMQAAEMLARDNARPFVELETRIELIENHATFAALGYSKVAESAHPGFARPTSITMRKPVLG
jgi:GNAT superfamily N-acetyltransferase